MRKLFLTFALVFLASSAYAEVKLPPIFGDHMVLQQKSDAAIWGYAAPGATVTITPSWSASEVTIKADADGKWFARLATPGAGGPYEISFDDGLKTVLKNVMIGEV